jgi:hypothetical protein
MQRTNRSGFKGARWIKKCSKYRAQIVFRGKAVSLGYYKTAREAALAYDYVAGKVFGEFARTRITGLTDHSNP